MESAPAESAASEPTATEPTATESSAASCSAAASRVAASRAAASSAAASGAGAPNVAEPNVAEPDPARGESPSSSRSSSAPSLAFVGPLFGVASLTGRKFLISGCGYSATTLPGFNRFCGSKTRFTDRYVSANSPYCRWANHVRLSPNPCSPLIVPSYSNVKS